LTPWNLVSKKLSGPSRKRQDLNLDEINDRSEDNDVAVVTGKVLSLGEIKKKIRISALGYSEGAKAKLTESKIEFNYLDEEIKSNPDAKGIKIMVK